MKVTLVPPWRLSCYRAALHRCATITPHCNLPGRPSHMMVTTQHLPDWVFFLWAGLGDGQQKTHRSGFGLGSSIQASWEPLKIPARV